MKQRTETILSITAILVICGLIVVGLVTLCDCLNQIQLDYVKVIKQFEWYIK